MMTAANTKRWILSLLMVTALSTLGAGGLAAHGEATLRSPSGSVPAGETILLNGSGFTPGQTHRLLLRGTLEERELQRVTAAADSTFSVEVRVPGGARPGQYRIVAVAPDGDEVATLNLAVLAAEGGSSGVRPAEEPSGEGALARTEGDGAASSPQARADGIRIQRSRAGIEWGLIGLLVGLAGGLGVGLLRRA